MKFLLAALHAKYIHTGLAVYSLRSYVGDSLRQHVEIAEYTINQRTGEILADLYRRKPDAIGFSCYIWNISAVKQLIREFHKLRPEVPIWLGGPEVSYECQDILEELPEVTGIMAGEGEETFQELLQRYVEAEGHSPELPQGYVEAEGHSSELPQRYVEAESYSPELPQECGQTKEHGAEPYAERQADAENGREGGRSGNRKKGLCELRLEVPGTVTRDGVYGEAVPLDLDALPFYYEELDSAEREQAEHKIIYYESGRGCPFRCSYCLSSLEKSVRLKSVEKVKRELQYFLDKKVKQVKFIDRTFNCNKEHALAIWRFLSEHDNSVTNFHFEISAELLTEEELKILAQMRPGLIQLEIGVQTTNRETLTAIRRSSDIDKLKTAVRAVHGFQNIHQHLDLIAGLPYEDLECFRKSFNDVYAMKPDQLQLGFLKVLKGSEMYERAKVYGIVYQSEPPYEVLYTKWLSYEDLLELKKVEEMVELFYNSGQFHHTLLMLQNFFESPYGLFLALAQFYEENGYFLNSPARSYRYEILLKFAESLGRSRGGKQDASRWRSGDGKQDASRWRSGDGKQDTGGWQCGDGKETGEGQYGFGQSFDGETAPLFRELLTFDFYLREKAKSRPSFADDLQNRYQEIAAFYRQEEVSPKLLAEYVRRGCDSRQMMRMTHMEIFHYPVWDETWIGGQCLKKPGDKCMGSRESDPEKTTWQEPEYFVLFDYERRNPLNRGAWHTVVRAERACDISDVMQLKQEEKCTDLTNNN